MSRKTLAWALWAIAWSLFSAASAQAEDRFARIATGGQTGVYYVAGQSICRFLNRGAAEHGITCEAPASGGGVANVKGMRSGEFNFAIMQADHQYKALYGLAPFAQDGAMADLRAVLSLQSEVFTVLARRDAAIAELNEAEMIQAGLSAPLHEGAVRYYRERGWL